MKLRTLRFLTFLFLVEVRISLADFDSVKTSITIEQSTENKCNGYCFSVYKPIFDLVNLKDDQIKRQNEEIINLKNQIKSMETKCEQTTENFPDSCPSGNKNGIYQIKIKGMEPFKVPCMSPVSGWSVIQRRFDGSENFNRTWEDYKNGFGDVKGEFFIGLEKLHRMTEERTYELYIRLRDVNGINRYGAYDSFKIGSEEESYELKTWSRYSGNAVNYIENYGGNKFTTFDRDNVNNGNCSEAYYGGWWYNECAESSLNGIYYKGRNRDESERNGIFWSTSDDYYIEKSLTFVEMMIRPISFQDLV
ncbi:angiopoietin-related protein 1-like [Drosophila rhopaloa]|uniref:Angiopoietin-related protein 1-like n=1 Tax=Drosophila rhopaloa TaxID=1041015 RepID=A0A6P4FMC7_DRORH|nr:angiopoietin-related protein 1-like [Drosophila rhopaloa]